MYKIGNDLIKRVKIGDTEVKKIYLGEKQIYPNVVEQINGEDRTEWVYNLPKRTRTITPWTQDLYGDGSLGEKVYGSPYLDEETAEISYKNGDWNYTNIESSGARTCIKTTFYTFKDGVEKTTKATETDPAISRTETYSYSYLKQSRTLSIVYQFSDNYSYIIDKGSESGEIAVIFSATFNTTTIPAAGGSITLQYPTNQYMTWKGTRVDKSVPLANLQLVNSGTVPTGFSIGSQIVTAQDRQKTLGDARSCSVYLQAIATIDGESFTVRSNNTITITQSGNYLSRGSGSVTTNPTSLEVISGTNYTVQIIPSLPFTYNYSSGATDTIYSLGALELIVNPLVNWITIVNANTSSFTMRCTSGGTIGMVEVYFVYKNAINIGAVMSVHRIG
ncbi:MAG: hypothetical protein LUH10_08345 [Tannerellaceae bacterium]|nr:hypothetical protein [Tannerellaceae bacterium]